MGRLINTPEGLELRRTARMRLSERGYSESALRGTPRLIAVIERESGLSAGDDPQGLLELWVVATNPEPARRPKPAQPYKGEIVPPADRNKLRGEYRPSAGYLANLERARAAQPKVVTMTSNVYRPGQWGV